MNPCPCTGAKCTLSAADDRHGSTYAYKKLGCRCDLCRDAQAASSARYRAENPEATKAAAARYYARNREAVLHRNRERVPHLAGTPTRAERYALAERLLVDGAGYREASRTVGVDHGTLADHFPGYGLAPTERGERAQIALKARALDQGLDPSALAPAARPAADVVELAELLDAGHSYAEAARRSGWSSTGAARRLPGRGYAPDVAGRHARAARTDRARGLAA
ncbi:helix-turn-helix DNA binding domain protein [Microbacterium phage Honk]|uniref:Helix-turn-helix DNA binding domain protein n=1 Tax=Microbacterium phage Honk TaxID=2836095 RepID=A0A8F3E5V5_9CAUD|nr:helix-turn-helix DNA binding domain protein [Microbacterium phage Honk]